MSNSVEKIRGIYAITPDVSLNLDQVEKVITQHHISILQYRRKTADDDLKLKEATKLRQLCLQHHTLFIINDDINLAQKVGADGVHLGKNDTSIGQARQLLKDDAIIGMSCYDDINLAINAQEKGATYVAFGALFTSSTKPDAPHCSLDTITQAQQILTVPIVGIGGVDFNNQEDALKAGCTAIGMISALFKQ